MGYCISYEDSGLKKPIRKHNKFQKTAILKLGMIVTSVLFILTLHQSSDLRRLFLPGNKQITERAIVELVESLYQGEKFDEAITTFCREIIDNGNQKDNFS